MKTRDESIIRQRAEAEQLMQQVRILKEEITEKEGKLKSANLDLQSLKRQCQQQTQEVCSIRVVFHAYIIHLYCLFLFAADTDIFLCLELTTNKLNNIQSCPKHPYSYYTLNPPPSNNY